MATPRSKLPLPAIEGGTPVRASLLPYGRQTVTEDDIQAVVAALRSDWLTTGPKVAEFEECLAAAVGASHAVAFSSGTAALHATAFAAGLAPGDEAITTPLTFAATANCMLYQGATPRFADITNDTLNLDPAQVEAKLTSQTRAIYAVDYAGHPADLDALAQIAARHKLLLVEDACHALGAQYGDRPVGSIAHMTVFSFHPVKHVTTGEGGMVTSGDAQLAQRLRTFRNHGINSDSHQRQAAGQWHYEMTELGYNYRLPDVACALGISQLARLPQNLARRRAIAEHYRQAMASLPGVILPAVRPEANPAWHLYPIRIDGGRLRVGRAEVFRALRAENIGVNVHYPPLHLHPYYRQRFDYRGGEFPLAEAAYEQLLSLPMFHGMSDADVEDVIAAVTKVVSYYAR